MLTPPKLSHSWPTKRSTTLPSNKDPQVLLPFDKDLTMHSSLMDSEQSLKRQEKESVELWPKQEQAVLSP